MRYALALAITVYLSTAAFAQTLEIGPRGVEVEPPEGDVVIHRDCERARSHCLREAAEGEGRGGRCEREYQECIGED